MGHAFQSPLRRWDVVVGLCQAVKATSLAEVGCKEGHTTGQLVEQLPGLRVLAIDPWKAVPNADEDYKDWDFKAIEKAFWSRVGKHKDRVTQLRMTSIEAAQRCHKVNCGVYTNFPCDCPPRQFDVVFIDAGHDYENALADIRAWWPLVRDGGFLCGHDFQHKFPGVMRAVAEVFPLMRVGVCPDSMWCVQKEAGLRIAA